MKFIGAGLSIFVLLTGMVLFDYIYYPAIKFRAADAAEEQMEYLYQEDFTIVQNQYSKILGEEEGSYTIDAYPVRSPEIPVRISISQSMELLSEDYQDMKWRMELNEDVESLLKEKIEEFSLMVNVAFPEEIRQQYSLDDSYAEILAENPDQINNYIFLHVFQDPSENTEEELGWLYELVLYLNNQQLEEFTITAYFYPAMFVESLSDKDKQEEFQVFEVKYGINKNYVFRYTSKNAEREEINPNTDDPKALEVFLREITVKYKKK